jgi:hypothetical protein
MLTFFGRSNNESVGSIPIFLLSFYCLGTRMITEKWKGCKNKGRKGKFFSFATITLIIVKIVLKRVSRKLPNVIGKFLSLKMSPMDLQDINF